MLGVRSWSPASSRRSSQEEDGDDSALPLGIDPFDSKSMASWLLSSMTRGSLVIASSVVLEIAILPLWPSPHIPAVR